MSDDQLGTPIRLPAIRKSWWRRVLCRHPQRSIWQENGRWHSRCLDCGAQWCGRAWHHWEIRRRNDTWP
jgi:hypothetical protein